MFALSEKRVRTASPCGGGPPPPPVLVVGGPGPEEVVMRPAPPPPVVVVMRPGRDLLAASPDDRGPHYLLVEITLLLQMTVVLGLVGRPPPME